MGRPTKKHTPEQTEQLRPGHHVLARLISEGKPMLECGRRAFPQWKNWKDLSVQSEVSRMKANPQIQELIELHSVGAQELGRAFLPSAVKITADLMQNAKKEDLKLKAADSIQDRFGAPRGQAIALHADLLALSLLSDLNSIENSIEAEVINTHSMQLLESSERVASDSEQSVELPEAGAVGLPPSPSPPPQTPRSSPWSLPEAPRGLEAPEGGAPGGFCGMTEPGEVPEAPTGPREPQEDT